MSIFHANQFIELVSCHFLLYVEVKFAHMFDFETVIWKKRC